MPRLLPILLGISGALLAGVESASLLLLFADELPASQLTLLGLLVIASGVGMAGVVVLFWRPLLSGALMYGAAALVLVSNALALVNTQARGASVLGLALAVLPALGLLIGGWYARRLANRPSESV